MKKLLTSIVISLCCMFTCGAQPIITAASFTPLPGESFLRYECDSTGINAGGSGANQTWDFSNIHQLIYTDTTFYRATGSFGMDTFVHGCNLACRSSLYAHSTFIRANNDSMINVAIGIPGYVVYPPVAFYDIDPNVVLTFPFHLNDHIKDTFTLNFLDKEAHSKYTEYDGYGTLMLGTHTYTNVVRLQNIVFDSIWNTYGGPITPHSIDTIYEYYVAGYHFPLLSIKIINGTGKLVYMSQQLTTDVKTAAATRPHISIYPNPAGKLLYIEGTGHNDDISICNTASQIMPVTINYSAARYTADISTLPAGIYYLNYRSENNNEAVKFVKE